MNSPLEFLIPMFNPSGTPTFSLFSINLQSGNLIEFSLPLLSDDALSTTIISYFFLVSNFGVWAGGTMYPKNFSGLITCYAAGVPFIHNTIISDVLFTTVLFGTYYLLQVEYSSLKIKPLKYS